MKQIAVIGLGYVGLPLALEFGKHYETIGYDISEQKIKAYEQHIDPSGEVSFGDFQVATKFKPTTDITEIRNADFIIIAMPTPVDENNVPDFQCLIDASTIVGQNMKAGSTVIYESTVYPGATEEVCIPVLEEFSGLEWKKDFYVGYSPERISPGDKQRTLTKIKKIVSGDTRATLGAVSTLYKLIIEAGVYEAPSIRVAEAAKVVENIQRDVNIALMNELSTIFNKLDLDTNEVLDAASSKWNFVNFRPGLVGGHCIGVDPYYLISKADSVGHDSKFLKQAREVNNSMASFIASQALEGVEDPSKLKVAVFGLTFKEDCKDMRNSKVVDLVKAFKDVGAEVFVNDVIADEEDVVHEYGFNSTRFENIPVCDVVVLAVPHHTYLNLGEGAFISKLKNQGTFVDVKGKFDPSMFESVADKVWRM